METARKFSRPHAKIIAVFCVLNALAWRVGWGAGDCTVTLQEIAYNSEEVKLFHLINQYRAELGLVQLVPSQIVSKAMAWKAKDRFLRGFPPGENPHIDTLGRDPWDLLVDCGAPPTVAMGEVGLGDRSEAQSVLTAWKLSPAHNSVITKTGARMIGIGQYGPVWFAQVVRDFADPAPPPMVVLTGPLDGARVSGVIELQGTAWDARGAPLPSGLSFRINGAQVGSSLTPPYKFTWNTGASANGAALFTAQGTDSSGVSSLSHAANIQVANPTGAGDGLAAAFYDNVDFSGGWGVRLVPTLDMAWTGGPTAPPPISHPLEQPFVFLDAFSVRWTGQILPEFSENYTFHILTDGGVRLWVDDQKIIDKWTDQPLMEHTGSLALTAGKRANIKAEFFNGPGATQIRLSWSSPSRTKQVIPTSRLFSTEGSSSIPLDRQPPNPPARLRQR